MPPHPLMLIRFQSRTGRNARMPRSACDPPARFPAGTYPPGRRRGVQRLVQRFCPKGADFLPAPPEHTDIPCPQHRRTPTLCRRRFPSRRLPNGAHRLHSAPPQTGVSPWPLCCCAKTSKRFCSSATHRFRAASRSSSSRRTASAVCSGRADRTAEIIRFCCTVSR